ncbi:MAG: hypothetical protein HUU46_03415 [Candidatus Hydrogenedentes bacterium]|nr:hypothetical protein [Candidatus Hydrogenedentota bacterium]
MMNRAFCTALCTLVLHVCSLHATASEPAIQAELNGLRIAIDPDSGGLRELAYNGMTFLKAAPANASLIDAAYPGTAFDPLRVGTRHSRGARVDVSNEGVVIAWDALGASREFSTNGPVAATVTIKPAADGRSINLSATVSNQSALPIPQVLFPDLDGLQPFAGEDGTELRTCGFAKKPFLELKMAEDDGRWYASRRNWLDLQSGAYDKSMAARWLDLGSLQGGFSLFPRLWSWGPLNDAGEPATNHVLLHLSQLDGSLRLMCEHRVTIDPGETWTSPDYVLTPHRQGWAKGIEPFRAWIAENVQRPYPLPDQLRETLGFRTVWMAQQYANADPADPTVVWRFNDLPELAGECRDHGLNEMVLWLWQPWEVPDRHSPELGTAEEFVRARDECRANGVNVSLFVSVMTMLDPIPAKYGWTDAAEFWGYHTDYVPMLRPYYGKASRGSFADQSHPGWQSDVTGSLLKLVENDWTSITWDQARYAPNEPNIETIFRKVRTAAKARNPESTFAAEDLNNLDLDSRWLDYTWNWALFSEDLDWRALVNAYPAPRFNVNVGTSPRAVKRLFMDHLFLNVMPSKPEGINGSARIADFPELSRALKTCATLHEKFRNHFENGLPIGDCILSEPCANARVNAYVLPESVLVIVMNTGAKKSAVTLSMDVRSWLASQPEHCTVTTFDESGSQRSERNRHGTSWRESISGLQRGEFALLTIDPRM